MHTKPIFAPGGDEGAPPAVHVLGLWAAGSVMEGLMDGWMADSLNVIRVAARS